MSDDDILEEDGYDPFEFPDEPGIDIDLNLVAQAGAEAVYEAIQNASNNTARSAQQQSHRIGISNLGHCRQYAKYMVEQIPFSDERDKTAAFFGTVAGDAIEAQLKIDHPGWLIQDKLTFATGDYAIPGTCDICIPASEGCTYEEFLASREEGYVGEKRYMQGVWDNKSKAELESIKKYGPTMQQIYQVHAYAKGQILKGNLDPSKPIIIMDVFFDRSGRDVIPYGVAHLYRESVVDMIREWIEDVEYAVKNHEDASRDMDRDWCYKYCEYATHCRGFDTDVSGLITDPVALQHIELYIEANDMEAEGKKRKKVLKPLLEGISGSTGTHNVRTLHTNEAVISYTRAASTRLDIRPIPKGKPTKAQLAKLEAQKELEQ